MIVLACRILAVVKQFPLGCLDLGSVKRSNRRPTRAHPRGVCLFTFLLPLPAQTRIAAVALTSDSCRSACIQLVPFRTLRHSPTCFACLPDAGCIGIVAPLCNSFGAFRAHIPYTDMLLGAIGGMLVQCLARGSTRANCTWRCPAKAAVAIMHVLFPFFNSASAAALL